jgi:Ca2+-binding EF-hand superfamily protein
MASSMQAALIQAQSQSSTSSSTSASSSGSAGGQPDTAELFSKLDTNGDGSVTRDEFVSGRPENVSEDQAGSVFDSLAASASASDSSSLTQSQFTQALEKNGPPPPLSEASDSSSDSSSDQTSEQTLIAQVLAALQQALTSITDSSSTTSSTSSSSSTASASSTNGRADPAELFSKLDTNGDGSVTRDEFVSGRPDNVSQDQASSFFDRLTSSSSDSSGMTQSQFVSAFAQNAAASSSESSATTTSSSTSSTALLDQLLRAIDSYRSASPSQTEGTTASVTV